MRFNDSILIDNFMITRRSKTFVIAECGVNHNGDMNLAKEMIDVAVSSGVNAVKFQTFKTEHLILKGIDKAP